MTQTKLSPGRSEDAAVQLEQDFVRIVREAIGMHEDMAQLFSRALVRGLRKQLGGQEIYVPAPSKDERDAAIRREFNGQNLEEMMAKYLLSKPRIYEIVRGK